MVDKYDEKPIKILKGLDAVRKRPGMYIGDFGDGTGLFGMLMEVVSNSVDQFLAAKASLISVCLHDNGDVEVIDNGEGMPVSEYHGKPAIEVIMTTLHTEATWDNHRPHTHVGSAMGVGLAPINALSDYLEVDSYKNGTHWHIRFDNTRTAGLEDKGATDKRGTRIRFHPSPEYFTSWEFDERAVSKRFEELSFLCPGLTFKFQGKAAVEEVYYCPKGFVGYLEKTMPSGTRPFLPILHFEAREQNTKVELALCWSDGVGCQRSFANHLCTKDGGVHVDAVVLGLVKAASISSSLSMSAENWARFLCKGLYFVVHVNVADPKFAAPTKDRLVNEDVFNAVVEATYQKVKLYFFEHSVFLMGGVHYPG